MAESILFNNAESLIGKLASLAYEEAAQAVGVYGSLRVLQGTLSIIKKVLMDAEKKQKQDPVTREWLKQIKHVFSDAEDLIDEFECEALRKQVVKAHGSTKTKVEHFFSSSNPLVFRPRMAHQIKELTERLDKIAADRRNFDLENQSSVIFIGSSREETSYSCVSDSDVFGMINDKQNVIDLLLQSSSGDDKDKGPCVIPIVGIAGSGKTTLAKLVFDDRNIDGYFSLKMWVNLSGGFDRNQIMRQMFRYASHSIPLRDVNNLRMNRIQGRLLKDILASQRFLLIFDDAWNVDRVKWLKFRNLLKAGAEGSKILVMTRDYLIASMMGTVPSYVIGDLLEEDCMSLLSSWVGGHDWTRNPNLLEIGKAILKKCEGNPLAVRTVGSLLYSNLDEDTWRFIRDNEVWNMKQDKDGILPAIKLSYDRLPSYLRQCFACLFLYPKGFQFDSDEVAKIWMALGLLQSEDERRDLEDLGRQYVLVLNSKSLLRDFRECDGKYFFRVHDLVQYLGMYEADDFLMVSSRSQGIPQRIRHLSLVEKDLAGATFFPKYTSVRTILFPVKGVGADSEAFLLVCVSKYKYLRVLDLSDSSYKSLPHSIGKLKHLRYLNLSNNVVIKKLPSSICKLQSLQTLLLSGCKALETLPKGLRMLISLRHFSVTTKQYVLPENDIASLNSLQVLTFEHCHNLESLLEGIQFSNLKELSIDSCGRLEPLLPYIKHLPGLQLLSVLNCEKLDMSEAHNDNLDPFPELKFVHFQGLPQLVTLPQWLQGAADTLLKLVISSCRNLEVLQDWLSSLKRLTTLHIRCCPKLGSLPNDMRRLSALTDLEIHGCPQLYQKYQPHVGECWTDISHIPRISITELGEEITDSMTEVDDSSF